MESVTVQVSIHDIKAAANLFINQHDQEQMDMAWLTARQNVSAGFNIGPLWIVKPITAEQRFCEILEVIQGITRVPLEQRQHDLMDHPWYERAHTLKNVVWLSVDLTMWLSLADAEMISTVLEENQLGEKDRLL